MELEHYPFVNKPLPYAYDALEPYIDAKTMQLHHDRHLQTYIDNLNDTLRHYPRLQDLTLEQLIRSIPRLPRELQSKIRNNAGGVYNHRLYFNGMTGRPTGAPDGALADAINRNFGGFDRFAAELDEAALSVFGSGYAWLVYDRGRLKIVTTPNQCTPIENGLCPILTVDVWEHAYYLKHYNRRADYIPDWFSVINWNNAERNYLNCSGR